MMWSTRQFGGVSAAVAAFALGSAAAIAQSFPTKPVTILVPYPAGGLSDVIARVVNNPLSKTIGQTVIVDNLGGAAGSIAAQKVLSSPADGHLVFQGSPNELILAPLAMSAVKFKSEDFRLVQMIGDAPMAIFARKDLPASNADELVAYAKKAAAENKPMTYASVGPGSFYHLLGEELSKKLGVAMTHVPYKGGQPARQDLLGGMVDIFMTPYGQTEAALVKEGKLKAVAVFSKARQPLLPTVPSVDESAALKGFNWSIWTGYFVSKDTPEPIVQSLHKSIATALSDPDLRKGLEAQNIVPATPLSLQDTAKAYADGTARFRAIAKSINLQPQ